MAPRDPWLSVPGSVERIRLLTSHGMTVPDIKNALKRGKMPAPPDATGRPQAWTEALVSAGQEYVRRQAAATASPATGGDDASDPASTVAALATVRQRMEGQTAEEWEAWCRSRTGRAEIRRVQALALMRQIEAAVQEGQTAALPRLTEMLARLTDTMSGGQVDVSDPAAVVDDLDVLCQLVLEALPVVVAMVGRDAMLQALGLRERHVEASA